MVDQRKTAAQRGYGSRWQKARLTFLRKYPLCADHLARGVIVQGNVVDHITPHRGDMTLFWDSSNWQTLCTTCHSSHKQAEEHSGRVPGCGVDGIPIDANHHWKR